MATYPNPGILLTSVHKVDKGFNHSVNADKARFNDLFVEGSAVLPSTTKGLDLQLAYNNSPSQPQILTTSALGSVVIRQDAGAVVQSPLTIQDGAGADLLRVQAGGNNTVLIGTSAVASAANSVAIGSNPTASGVASVAIGLNSNASNEDTVAIGSASVASGANSVAIGQTATAQGLDSVAIGNLANTSAGGSKGIAIGEGATVLQAAGIAIGDGASASGAVGIALGPNAATVANRGLALTNQTLLGGAPAAANDALQVVINGTLYLIHLTQA